MHQTAIPRTHWGLKARPLQTTTPRWHDYCHFLVTWLLITLTCFLLSRNPIYTDKVLVNNQWFLAWFAWEILYEIAVVLEYFLAANRDLACDVFTAYNWSINKNFRATKWHNVAKCSIYFARGNWSGRSLI